MGKEKTQVNTEMNFDLIGKLDEMCLEDENNRSQFIRKLIRQEWERRKNMFFSTKKEQLIHSKQQTSGSK